jgi:hypothetical protein
MSYHRDNRRRYRNDGGNRVIQDDDFIALAQSALERIKSGEDLEDLERLKKVFKKTVPWGIRNYLGVYMTRLWLQKHGKELPSRGTTTAARSESTNHEASTLAPVREGEAGTLPRESRRANIPAEESATVYIGIGRTRRVSKGNIITLLAKVAELDRARIGEIRILDSYTFVQLYADDADDVIAKLDGYEFHGKGLSVGYSRKEQDE